MISAAQIRAARALLGLSAVQLAERAGVDWSTVQRFETADGVPRSRSGTLERIKQALEQAGIDFIGDPISSPGVQLRQNPKKNRSMIMTGPGHSSNNARVSAALRISSRNALRSAIASQGLALCLPRRPQSGVRSSWDRGDRGAILGFRSLQPAEHSNASRAGPALLRSPRIGAPRSQISTHPPA